MLSSFLACGLCLTGASCGGGGSSAVNTVVESVPSAASELTMNDVQTIVQRAVASANEPMVVAVTNRSGVILAVFQTANPPVNGVGNFGSTPDAKELAVSLARTGAFFSNDQAPLSSRTVRFISGIHFPPGVSFTPNAALYGIENTNRGCPLSSNFASGQVLLPARSIDGSTTGLGITTGKADLMDSQPFAVNPGGVPIFHNGHVVGGIGVVAGAAGDRLDVAEFAALTGSVDAASGFGPNPAAPGVVVIDGIALPFVNQMTLPADVGPGPAPGMGGYFTGPFASPGPVPDGDLVLPQAGLIGGLSQQEVAQIVANAVATASVTRAAIRLPLGSRTRMVIAVADLDGTILALHRMPDATVFSVDVAVSKARNMAFFNSSSRMACAVGGTCDLPGVPMGTAVTNRTISFGAQPFFPPGIDGSGPGPFFSLYAQDTANPCTQGSEPPPVGQQPNLRTGIVFFPGSSGLYRGTVLVGGFGISGDGVEQDDFVTAGGICSAAVNPPITCSPNFEAPTSIRADQIFINSVRLPYLKFPRNPTQ